MTANRREPEARFALPDGSTIATRPIGPDDASALQRFHHRLSQRSVYLRFFGIVPELSDERARYFTQVDDLDRIALVALDPLDPSEIIAVARLDRIPGTETGEYAAIVEDHWQGRGIGLALTRALLSFARERGFLRIFGLVLPENDRMLALLRDLGLPTRTRSLAGVVRVEVDLWAEEAGSVREISAAHGAAGLERHHRREHRLDVLLA